MLTSRARRLQDDGGVVTVIFAILLPLFLVFGSVVVSVGSWYTHARQLQTKVDAAAHAAAGAWSFPCAPDVDQTIADTARKFFGAHTTATGTKTTSTFNTQVGGVQSDQLYVSLNQLGWWDDGGFTSTDFTSPAGSVCEAKALDVKATENDSPLLWGWLPFFPDIKRKARVEIEQAEGVGGILPIAVRVPRPVSTAAIIYDESNDDILAVRAFEPTDSIVDFPGAGLDGYSTMDAEPAVIDSLPAKAGVAIALSFRPTCDTPGVEGPCFKTSGFTTVDQLCNQGTGTQIVKCYHAGGNWPSQNMQAGLHFLRGYGMSEVGDGPPQVRAAYLDSRGCEANGYFNPTPSGSCHAELTVNLDLGSAMVNLPGPGGPEETRIARDVEVRYKLVRGDGSTYCDFGDSCHVEPAIQDKQGVATFRTTDVGGTARHPLLTAGSGVNAIALQIRVRNSPVNPNPGGCSVGADFNNNCRWFVTSSYLSPSVPPTNEQIIQSPIQRSFMGNLDLSGPVKWVRIGKDEDCNRVPEDFTYQAAAHPTGDPVCFVVDMGLKGGMAKDQDEPPFAFNEGSGPSQMGSVDCDPNIQQGQVLIDGVINGCRLPYAEHKFDSDPLCPGPSQFFTLPKDPASPWKDWAPFTCVKTRPTGSMNQLIEGLNMRIFGVKTNPRCPTERPDENGDGQPEFTAGRNYWHRLNNGYDKETFAWDGQGNGTGDPDGTRKGNSLNPNDPRLVNLFFTPYDSFSGSGQEVFPVVAVGSFYITGYGRVDGSGGLQGGRPGDPCSDGNNGILTDGTGNEPPPDLNELGGSAGGTIVWGHFLKYVPQNADTTGGTGVECDERAFHPCVGVLVE